ncbi:MAG: hypothetical protein RL748_4590 [Pseudomonadota bacterium]|jgi:hypothetical protein
MKAIYLIAFATLQLSGCTLVNTRETSSLLNPHKIHEDRNVLRKDAHRAALIPIEDYYKSLQLAKTTYEGDANAVTEFKMANQKYVVNYVNEGIGLVNSYCRRWFQEIDDTQRLLTLQDKNVNVISALGTALLGIGKANANVITGYGAANVAYTGYSDNINTTFLVAPSTTRVKEHIEVLMNAEAEKLLKETTDNQVNFKQAYTRLERYASFCTHSQARQIVNNALEVTQTELGQNGRIKTSHKP